ncbi:GFA family protein [Brevundimonas sp.]|uniref:GFA family protein n=1 Tax=Brevundimonas sp. TaxID=1871086 RepID=UPI0028A087E8|nr:GFA family protein [Brevundimonas sp.]
MSDWKLPWTGACLCGQVKVRVTEAPVVAAACHCRACQKLTGGAYSLSLMLPASGLSVEGETEIGGLHNPVPEHHFCPSCKNWLFTRGIAGGAFVNVRPSLLDDGGWVVPYADTWTAQSLPGVQSGARVHYPEFPPVEDYAGLMEGYARDGVRPG